MPDNSNPSRPRIPGIPRNPGQNGHGTRPGGEKPGDNGGKTEPIESFALSSVQKARKTVPITTILSCSGGVPAQELAATVKFDPKLLKFKHKLVGAALARYTDLEISAEVKTREDTLEIRVAAPAGKTFTAEGQLLKLSFDVLNYSSTPTALPLHITRFGIQLNARFVEKPTKTTDAEVSFDYVPIDEKAPGPASRNYNCSEDDYSPRPMNPAHYKLTTASAVGCGINLLDAEREWYDFSQVADKRVVNFTGLNKEAPAKPDPSVPSMVGWWSVDYAAESNLKKIQEKFEASVKVSMRFGMFKGSVSSTYSRSESKTTEKAYSKLWAHYYAMMDYIWDYDKWKSRLKDDFWTKLNDPKTSPKALFDQYGTHIILKAYYGGVCDINAVSEKKISDTTYSISASLSASLAWGKLQEAADKTNAGSGNGAITGDNVTSISLILQATQPQNPDENKPKESPTKNAVDIEVKTDYTKSTYNESKGFFYKANFIGGASAQVASSLADTPKMEAKWCQEISSSENWRFVGPSKEERDLFPVWELLPARSPRRAELFQYFAQKSKYAFSCERYVTDIMFGWARSRIEALSDLEKRTKDADRTGNWIVDYHDLNKGVSNSGFLYLAYQVETYQEMRNKGRSPITGLFLYCDDKKNKGWQYSRFRDWVKTYAGQHIKLRGVLIGNNYSMVGSEWSGDDYKVQSLRISNLNHGKRGSGRFIVLCKTTDPRLEPLTGICAYYNEDGNVDGVPFKRDTETVIFPDSDWRNITQEGREYAAVCTTNAGHDDSRNDVYIAYKTADKIWNDILAEKAGEA